MHIDALFSQFVREKVFLKNISPATVKAFKDCERAYKRTIGDNLPTKQNLKEFVIQLQESGIAVTTVNYYIRSLNSFLTWMLENEYITEPLRIKKLKEPEKTLKTFSDEQLRLLLFWKPKDFYGRRLYTLIVLLIDTGIRT